MKKNKEGQKPKKNMLEEENEKITEKFGIDFLAWNDNLNKLDIEIKQLKKQKSLTKNSKAKIERKTEKVLFFIIFSSLII